MAAMRAKAATKPASSSARITPRLADSTSGLSTQGYRTRRAASRGSTSTRNEVKDGAGTPARASCSRMQSLSRVAATAATGLARSPSARPIAAPATVVRSSTGTTASSGRRAAYARISATAAARSSNGKVRRESGNSPDITFGRSEATTRSTSSRAAASMKSSVR